MFSLSSPHAYKRRNNLVLAHSRRDCPPPILTWKVTVTSVRHNHDCKSLLKNIKIKSIAPPKKSKERIDFNDTLGK